MRHADKAMSSGRWLGAMVQAGAGNAVRWSATLTTLLGEALGRAAPRGATSAAENGVVSDTGGTLSGDATNVAQAWTRSIDALAAAAQNRRLFTLLAVATALIFWMAPRLPMIDLPQHAAQVGLWRDMLLGTSPWGEFVRLNLFTPYLIGYGLALPLSFAMAPDDALIVVFTLAYGAFVFSCIQFRKELGGDPRLDWLFLPAFFSFAFHWGFLTFMVAAPLAIQVMRFSYRHALGRDAHAGAWIAGLGTVLLFGHGLAFLFAGLVGGLLVLRLRLIHVRSVFQFVQASWPFMVLASVCIGFFLISRTLEAPAELSGIGFGHTPITRLSHTIWLHVQGAFPGDRIHHVLTILLAAAPMLMRLPINRHGLIPFAALMAILLFVPHFIFATAYVDARFALYFLPLWALVFVPRRADAQTGDTLARERGGAALILTVVVISLAVHAVKIVGFGKEARDFETVLAAAEPRERALAVIEDRASAYGNANAYLHFGAYYQADKSGLVDFNFAVFHPAVVRYRTDATPAAGEEFAWQKNGFDWARDEAYRYRYVFVRHDGSGVPPAISSSPVCAAREVAAAGQWALWERIACPGLPGGPSQR